MASKTKVLDIFFKLLVSVCLLVVAIYLLDSRPAAQMNSLDNTIRLAPLVESEPQASPIFVYLTQTESCLPEYLKSPGVIGNATACQCDVLVLSYKENCTDTSLPHVQYTFDPTSTWTTGRNILYKTVMDRKQKYHYYTFLDDDAVLQFDNKDETGNPWREYEISLLRAQPPIAVGFWLPVDEMFKVCLKNGYEYSKDTNFVPITWYDAMFNSFHYKAVEYLLPYYEKMDKKSVWYSQFYMIIKSDIIFHGQALVHSKILALNQKHRPYARDGHWSAIAPRIVRDLRQEIPKQYQALSDHLLEDWRVNVTKKVKLCSFPLPPLCPPIIPYKNLKP